MKFAMLGAGGIGCLYAARLIQAGHQCVLVARGEHLQALQQNGLLVDHPDTQFHGSVDATDVAGLMKQHSCSSFDLLILGAKGGATQAMLAEMKTWLQGATTPILSIQNGVTNEALIEQQLGVERTIGGLGIYVSGHIVSPGHISAQGAGQIDFGAWPTAQDNPQMATLCQTLAEVFSDAGIPNRLYTDVRYALWRKLVINNGVNPLTALTDLKTGAITTDPILRRTVHTMMEETARAANAAGVSLTKEDVEEMFDLICNFHDIKTSMQVDMERGRTLEVNEICGPVIENCRKINQPAETTELIYKLLVNATQAHPAEI
ncbi:ketopantoate reductase family protein [Vibrio porteresiae]|uniref:2-dehydropantoate 2-reductase n=1 Tax=Vibrio porteresiae DSM 19223 TaxID=1123496 RepID=A0ABZ0QJ83_9VIBR|nr:2-dehydropantoate 2-reductase [Vibrio porteresiae]WPC75496.1 2-dehydropantoate 2-reductase [Vibrio porteresiae DSM 19223]